MLLQEAEAALALANPAGAVVFHNAVLARLKFEPEGAEEL